MASKVISHTQFDATLGLTECMDGFWLYDKTRGMNLSMRAKTKDDAFFGALKYYQRRLQEVEAAHKDLAAKVAAFVDQFTDEESENLHG